MSSWRALIFDLDDTLYPEKAYVFSGMRAVAHWLAGRLDLPSCDTFDELKRLFDQGVRGRIFDVWLESRDLTPAAWVPAMLEVYRQHEPNIQPYAAVAPLLSDLAKKFRLGLVSDGYLEVQKQKLAALKLECFFEAVVFSDALGRDAWKPDPRPFCTMLRHLSIPPSEAVYIADNPTKDFLGARRAGMASIRIRNPEGLHSRVEPASSSDAPDLEISNLDDLRGLLTPWRLQTAQ